MKKIVQYLGTFYATSVNPIAFVGIAAFLAIAIAINYSVRFETNYVATPPGTWLSVLKYIAFYAAPFSVAVALNAVFARQRSFLKDKRFYLLAVMAFAIFAMREMNWAGLVGLGDAAPYWRRVANHAGNWVVGVIPIILYWRATREEGEPLFGWSAKHIDLRPYWVMLLVMLPLVTIASFQADFLHTYPRAGTLVGVTPEQKLSWPHYAMFEIIYGLDFVFIEFFFRGFVVLSLAKICGRAAILPMAAFYVFIHFEKPMGEAISSFFGGMILGVIAYETRSILGGITVHLGIAWMMEAFAYLQKAFR